jgi:hypothetical protein
MEKGSEEDGAGREHLYRGRAMAQTERSIHRPRLAAVVTAYKKLLHPQHVVDRLLDGYGWNGTFHHPAMDVVSLYVDQRGEGDLSQERADRRNFPCREQSGTNLPTRVETRN